MMRRQRSVWAKIASPLMIAPSMGSVLSKVRAAVISLASGATRNCPMTPCSRSLNAASRCTPGTSPTALPRSRLPSIATCPAAGHGDGPRTKNGPALAGHGAEAVRDAITRAITTLPEQLRRSLTWDQGAEMAEPAELRIEAGVAVYFCDPHSPWQRGTNENTNGLLRQYFPKGMCGRPLRCKKNLWTAAALDRVLPCVRPLLLRLTGRGPVWEFVDQVHITEARSKRSPFAWFS